jgi:DNA-binding NtrC family response regulator
MVANTIRILLIDDDPSFYEIFVDHLARSMPDVSFDVDWYENLSVETHFDHDLYVLDDRISQRSRSVEMVDHIQKTLPYARIIVMSGHGNFDLLKNLIQRDITSFIDKDDDDLEPLAEEIEQILVIKSQLASLSLKAKGLRELSVGAKGG